MIDPHCSREVEGIIAYGASTGVAMKVTSTLRPGAVTISGNLSLHGAGLAVDFAGPSPGWDSEALGAIFRAFVPVEQHLAELIYAGPQVAYNIKHGRRVGKYAQSIHHNHVHVGVRRGVFLGQLVPTLQPESVVAEAPADHEGEDMAEPVDALVDPERPGGVWVLTKDGGIRTYHNAEFLGSYPGLPPEWRQGERTFVEITPRDDGVRGYMLHGSDGSLYRFP